MEWSEECLRGVYLYYKWVRYVMIESGSKLDFGWLEVKINVCDFDGILSDMGFR